MHVHTSTITWNIKQIKQLQMSKQNLLIYLLMKYTQPA